MPLSIHGTKFQTEVWNALLKIPYGETRSYQQIAGMIPCHRVIGASGDMVGYGGGLEIKKCLLELEREHSL